MLNLKDIKNTYWNNNGKYQQFVNEKLNDGAVDNLPIKKTLKDKYKNFAFRYYRFYNDGDRPRYEVFKNCNNEIEISETLERQINFIIEEIQASLK